MWYFVDKPLRYVYIYIYIQKVPKRPKTRILLKRIFRQMCPPEQRINGLAETPSAG